MIKLAPELCMTTCFVAINQPTSFCNPGSVAAIPYLVEVIAVALGIHGVPEAAMLANTHLAIARKLHQRFPLQHAALVRFKVFENIALEEEIAAVDPVVGKFRL